MITPMVERVPTQKTLLVSCAMISRRATISQG